MSVLKVFDDTRGFGRCRSCDAPITWFELVSGKRHPFNGPDLPVYLQTEHEPSTHRLIGHVDSAESHFATCPDADTFRRRRP